MRFEEKQADPGGMCGAWCKAFGSLIHIFRTLRTPAGVGGFNRSAQTAGPDSRAVMAVGLLGGRRVGLFSEWVVW